MQVVHGSVCMCACVKGRERPCGALISHECMIYKYVYRVGLYFMNSLILFTPFCPFAVVVRENYCQSVFPVLRLIFVVVSLPPSPTPTFLRVGGIRKLKISSEFFSLVYIGENRVKCREHGSRKLIFVCPCGELVFLYILCSLCVYVSFTCCLLFFCFCYLCALSLLPFLCERGVSHLLLCELASELNVISM